jgi:hypothetical protein
MHRIPFDRVTVIFPICGHRMIISVRVQWVDAGRFLSASDMGAISPDLLSSKFLGSLGSKRASKYSKVFLERRRTVYWTNGQLKEITSSLSGAMR